VVFNIANKFMKRNRHKLVMPHDATGMALMEDPSQGFGKVIRGIDDTKDELHHNVPRVLPDLDGKVLNVDMTRTLRGNTSVDHIDCGLVVTMQRCQFAWREPQLLHNGANVARTFGSRDSSEEFGFNGAGDSDGLSLVRKA